MAEPDPAAGDPPPSFNDRLRARLMEVRRRMTPPLRPQERAVAAQRAAHEAADQHEPEDGT